MPSRRLSRRELMAASAAIAASGACGRAPVQALTVHAPKATPAVGPGHLPRWRGFNLTEKLTTGVDAPYLEWDFDRVAEWGFDFIRLPTDYRIWNPSPGVYLEPKLREIDQAIAWGRQRRLHVCLCLHRAPGYGVIPPREVALWAEGPAGEEARRQFAAEWAMFAERYRGIASTELSFNLVNEPPTLEGAQYLAAARAAVDAIRAVDASRLVIADGRTWGREPAPELLPLGVAQSTRGYAPFQVSTYKAAWFEGASDWPEPVWPIPASLNRYLYGPMKPELHRALVLRGAFAPGPLAIAVHRVSVGATLVVAVDGIEILRRRFDAGPGEGAWRESRYEAEWGVYQATYDVTLSAPLPTAAREIRFEVVEGDWLTFSSIDIGGHRLVPRDVAWGVPQGEHAMDAQGELIVDATLSPGLDRAGLFARAVEPWTRFAREAKVGVHVGEWGVYNHTPHAVALAWMRDCLANWREAGFGWALWNLRGAFGVFDSERTDVAYEPYRGHRLDRRMLELLREDLST